MSDISELIRDLDKTIRERVIGHNDHIVQWRKSRF